MVENLSKTSLTILTHEKKPRFSIKNIISYFIYLVFTEF